MWKKRLLGLITWYRQSHGIPPGRPTVTVTGGIFTYMKTITHGENVGTLGMVPLIINPIYTLYSGYLLGFMG